MYKSKKEKLGALLLNSDGAHAVEVINLRPSYSATGSRVLKAVGKPLRVKLSSGMKPALMLNDVLVESGGGRVSITEMLKSRTTDVSRAARVALSSEDIGEVPGDFLSALPQSSRSGLLMCSEGIARVEISDGKAVVSGPKEYPSIRLYATDAGKIMTGVSECTLSQTYGSGIINERDTELLSGSLARAYCKLCGEAVSSGLMIQPVLARYKLYGREGEEVYVSAPVLLSHSSGSQCSESQPVYSNDRKTVAAYNLEVSVWRGRVLIDVGEQTAGSEISRADIFFTPMFHPYHPDYAGHATAGRQGDMNQPFARVDLPGRLCGLTPGNGGSESILTGALSRLDGLERRVASINEPFSLGRREILLSGTGEPNADIDARTMRKALSKSSYAKDYRTVMLRTPHRFTARCAAQSGDSVAYGNLRVIRSRPYSVFMSGSGNASGSWRAIVAVKFSDGSGTIFTEEHVGDAPVSLNSVLSYPSPDAVELTVLLYSGGKNHKGVFPLRSDGSGERSVYISSDYRPIALAEASAIQTIDLKEKHVEFENVVAFAASHSPEHLQKSVDAGSVVRSIVSRTGYEQSWEFGRSRYVAGCAGGIYSAGYSSTTGRISLRSIANVSIQRSDALCRSDRGDVFAVAGDKILRISSGGKTEVLISGEEYVAVSYDESRDELHCLNTEGSERVFCRCHGWQSYRNTSVSAAGYAPGLSESIAYDGAWAYLQGREQASELTSVELSLESVPDDYYGVCPMRLRLCMQCEKAEMTVELRGVNVSGNRSFTLREAQISGSLSGPLDIAVASRRVNAMRLVVGGDVSSDFVFNSAIIVYK